MFICLLWYCNICVTTTLLCVFSARRPSVLSSAAVTPRGCLYNQMILKVLNRDFLFALHWCWYSLHHQMWEMFWFFIFGFFFFLESFVKGAFHKKKLTRHIHIKQTPSPLGVNELYTLYSDFMPRGSIWKSCVKIPPFKLLLRSVL